jgi:hypothetical protein
MIQKITPTMTEQIRAMVDKGYPRARVKAAFHITDGQLRNQLKKLGLKIKKDNWGLREVYFDLQGRKK